VLIKYDDLATVRDNFDFLAHTELMKSWDVPESNRMMTRCLNSKNVPTSTSSPSGISSTVVWLTQPLLGIGGPELASLLN
jgi:hypothetical protein